MTELGWIKVNRFCELSGYTIRAIQKKRSAGVWPEGLLWRAAPDGNIHIHWERYQQWVAGKPITSRAA